MKLRKFKTKMSTTPKTYGVQFMEIFTTAGKSENLQLLMGFHVQTKSTSSKTPRFCSASNTKWSWQAQ